MQLESHTLWPYVELYGRQGVQLKLDEEIIYRLGQFRRSEKAFAEAIHLYRQGQTAQNRIALAEFLMTPGLPDTLKDFKGGYRIYQELAQAGDAESQYRIAHLLCKLDKEVLTHLQELGEIRQKNDTEARQEALQKAVDFYRLAADQHHKRAASALAKLYYDWDSKNNSLITIQAPIPEKGHKDTRYQLEAALKYYRIAKQEGSESATRAVTKIEKELEIMKSQSKDGGLVYMWLSS